MKQFYYFAITVCIGMLSVQGQEITHDDYKRAVSFMHDNYNNKTAFNLHTSVNWFKDKS